MYVVKLFRQISIQDICFRECTEKRSELDPGFVYSSGRSFGQDSIFCPEQIYCNIGSVKKKNLMAKKTKRFNLIQKYRFLKIVWSSLWGYHWIKEVYYFFI